MPTYYELQQLRRHPDHGSVRSFKRRAMHGFILDHYAIPEDTPITQTPPRYTAPEDDFPPLVVRTRVRDCPSPFPPPYSEHPPSRQDSCVQVPWNAGRTRQPTGPRSTSYSFSCETECGYKCEREPRKPYGCVVCGERFLYQWLRATRKEGDGIDSEIRYYFICEGGTHLSYPSNAAIESLKACLNTARLREEEAVLLCTVALGTLYMQDRFEDNRTWKKLSEKSAQETREFLARVVKEEQEASKVANKETYSMYLRNLMPYVFQLDYSSDLLWPLLSESEFFEIHYGTAKAISCFVECLKSSISLSKEEIRALVKFFRRRISDPRIKISYGSVPDEKRNSAGISGNMAAITIFFYRYYCLVKSEGIHSEGAVPYPELTRVQRGYKAVEGLLRFDNNYLIPQLPVDKRERSSFQKKWDQTKLKYFKSWPEDISKGPKNYEHNECPKDTLADKCLTHISKKLAKLRKIRR